jgi:cytochrome d ubiquinol oxidase subunit II
MGIDLPVIWAVIIGFGLKMYVVMDGFDLGIGILFPSVSHCASRCRRFFSPHSGGPLPS